MGCSCSSDCGFVSGLAALGSCVAFGLERGAC